MASMTSTCSGSSAWAGVLWLGCEVSLIAVSLSLDDVGGTAPLPRMRTLQAKSSCQLSGAISACIVR